MPAELQPTHPIGWMSLLYARLKLLVTWKFSHMKLPNKCLMDCLIRVIVKNKSIEGHERESRAYAILGMY